MGSPRSPIAYSASGKRISLLNDPDPIPLGSDVAPLGPPFLPVRTALPPNRHPCLSCHKTFSTSGHLSRHAKIHSGSKEHVCPFPGCAKACSRLDNIVQHFRCHLPKQDRNKGNVYTRRVMDHLRDLVESGWECDTPATTLFHSSLYTGLIPPARDHSSSSSQSSPEQPVSPQSAAFLPSSRLLSAAPNGNSSPTSDTRGQSRWVVCSSAGSERNTTSGFEESFVRGAGPASP